MGIPLSIIRPEGRRLRVAHISPSLDVGGLEHLLVEFARFVDRQRWELTFVSLAGRGQMATALEALGWTVYALDEPPGLRPRMVLRLAELFRARGFDVIHTHDDKPLVYGSLAGRLARRCRLVHTQHHGHLPQLSRRQRLLAAWSGRLTDNFVCVSDDSARFMRASGLPSRKITVLRNGIDLDRFLFRGACPGGPAVTVARLSPEKDIANLLRAAAMVVATAPDFRLEIAGDGPQKTGLRNLAAHLNLGENVRFLGQVSDIPELLGRASLFVLPSQAEGISLTILEAMARGLPVVATNVGGNPEVVLAGTTGLLAPAKDPASLANRLLRVWQNPAAGAQMGRAGRERVEAHFDVRKMVADYERLYQGAALCTP